MKHLLQHTKMQILQELDKLKGPHVDNPKLEYTYEDLVDKIHTALEEIKPNNDPSKHPSEYDTTDYPKNSPFFTDEPNLRENDPVNPRPTSPGVPNGDPYKNPVTVGDETELRDGGFRFESGGSVDLQSGNSKIQINDDITGGSTAVEQDVVSGTDPNDPLQQMVNDIGESKQTAEESFEDMKERVQNISDFENLDPDRLRELADVAEKVHEDPQSLSTSDFEKLLTRLNPSLVDWAAGKKKLSNKLNENQIVQEIQGALQRARKNSDGNIDMLQTFQQEVSDSLFDVNTQVDE